MATPEFIKTLRAKVGTALLQVPTVSVLAHDDQGRVLLVQDKGSGLWGSPGGIVDLHALPSDAAVREAWEEAGVYVELTQLLGVFAGERFSVRYPNGDQLSGVETVFEVSSKKWTPSTYNLRAGGVKWNGFRDSSIRRSSGSRPYGWSWNRN